MLLTVFHYAAHVVARQAVVAALLALVAGGLPAAQAHHGHAVMAVAYVEVACPVVEHTTVAQRFGQLQRDGLYLFGDKPQFLHLSVAVGQPQAVGSRGNVVDARCHQPVLSVEPPGGSVGRSVHGESALCADEHLCRGGIPVERCDAGSFKVVVYGKGLARLACDAVDASFGGHPHMSLPVDVEGEHEVVRQSVGRADAALGMVVAGHDHACVHGAEQSK